jgi:transposase-like protein
MAQKRPNRRRLPVVTVSRPHCPGCGAFRLSTYASRLAGDVLERYCRCKTCHLRFRVLLQPRFVQSLDILVAAGPK